MSIHVPWNSMIANEIRRKIMKLCNDLLFDSTLDRCIHDLIHNECSTRNAISLEIQYYWSHWNWNMREKVM